MSKWLKFSGGILIILLLANLSCQKPNKEAYLALTPQQADSLRAGEGEIYGRRSLGKILGNEAEVFKKYGCREFFIRTYRKDTTEVLRAEIARCSDPENAFGLYSYYWAGRRYHIGQAGFINSRTLGFWKGHYFVRIRSSQADSAAEEILQTLARKIDRRIQDKGKKPDLISLLPEEFQYSPEVRYFRDFDLLNKHFYLADQDILHLKDKAEAVLSVYRIRGIAISLLLVRYPSVQARAAGEKDFRALYFPDHPKAFEKRGKNNFWMVVGHEGRYFIAIFDIPSNMGGREFIDLTRLRIREYEANLRKAKKKK